MLAELEKWHTTYASVKLCSYVIMPNHLHIMVFISTDENGAVVSWKYFDLRQPLSLSLAFCKRFAHSRGLFFNIIYPFLHLSLYKRCKGVYNIFCDFLN